MNLCRYYSHRSPLTNLSLYCPILSCSTPCRLCTAPPSKNLSLLRSSFPVPLLLDSLPPLDRTIVEGSLRYPLPSFYCTRTYSDRPSPYSSPQAIIGKTPSNFPSSPAPAPLLTRFSSRPSPLPSPNRTFTIAAPSFQVTRGFLDGCPSHHPNSVSNRSIATTSGFLAGIYMKRTDATAISSHASSPTQTSLEHCHLTFRVPSDHCY